MTEGKYIHIFPWEQSFELLGHQTNWHEGGIQFKAWIHQPRPEWLCEKAWQEKGTFYPDLIVDCYVCHSSKQSLCLIT